jgi:two-component system, NtrC family, response regulator AtoC
VLEQQEFVRVGGINNINVDVRIICATNKNLEEAIKRQLFRDDLFYRLNEITIYLPPVRERQEDIPLLVNYFIERYNELYTKECTHLSPEKMSRLMMFSWPGNVRQLENLIKQVVVRGDESIIDELLTNSMAGSRQSDPGDSIDDSVDSDMGDTYSLKRRVGAAVAREERKLIGSVLNKTNWNRRKAADLLEISYRSLLYKIKEYNLNSTK